jgi:rhodanese-related sulfurtransferase
MPDDLRINSDELKRRMAAGEQFTVIDVRNPHAWAEAADMASGAIRVALDSADQELPRIPRDKPIVTYCT